MGTLNRFKEVMEANINTFLENAENKNADKLLDQFLRSCKQDLANAKAEAAGYMANEKAAKRKLGECLDQVAKYRKYVDAATAKGNDSDARRFEQAAEDAGINQPELEAKAAAATADREKIMAMVEKLEGDVRDIETKIKDLTLKLADTKLTEKQNDAGGYTGKPNTLDDLCDKVNHRIDTADALASMNGSGDSDLADLEKSYEE